ncbi:MULTISPECIES: hypothetical protein [Bacteria]
MDDRTVLGSDEKSEMRGLVLAGAARADSIRRSRARLAVSVSAVVVVTGIAVGAVTASMYARSGDVVAIPAPAPADSATSGGGEPPSGIAAFARAATDADELPEGMSGDMRQSLRAETSRYVGEYEKVAYWVAEGQDPASICIVTWAIEREDRRGVACGGGELTSTQPGFSEAHLGPAGTAPEGWISLDENLSVNPNP